jgi:hypothetical protein
VGDLAKAKIINLDAQKRGDQDGENIPCMFNPNKYTISKTNQWTPGESKGKDCPPLEFGSGGAAKLSMELFFDTYSECEDPASVKDVRGYTNKLWKLMLVDSNLKDEKNDKGRPPEVMFHWGHDLEFVAVITSITQTFTLFATNGTPVRATLNVTFEQARDPASRPAQNPTSGGVGGERVWTVREGDTLAWIAYAEYGDSTRWRPIAQANRLTSVRRLQPGMMLEIPNG